MNALDIEHHPALRSYLAASGYISQGEAPSMRTLSGGVSNRAVLVERESGESWVVKQALSKLRVAVEWTSDPMRVHREAMGLRWLERLAPPGTTTPLVFEDHTYHLLAMQAVPQPHENWKTLLLRGEVDDPLVEQFGTLLGTVHREAYAVWPEIAEEFDDRSFFESLRVEPYYGYTASRVPQAGPFLQALIAETRSYRLTLVHGDYSPKNVLVYRGGIVLLDHEVVHFGDPAFDLGFSLTHFLSKAHHLPSHRRAFADAANCHWKAYSDSVGPVPWTGALEARVVRHTLGCLLARVDGRSKLEYLDEAEQNWQRRAVLSLINRPPQTVAELVDKFIAELERNGSD